MSFAIGRFNIPIILVSGCFALLFSSLTSNILIKEKLSRGRIKNILSNILFTGFISWKLAPVLVSFDQIIENPLSLLYLSGGRLGIALAVTTTLIYSIVKILKGYKTKEFITIILIFYALATLSMLISPLILNSTEVESPDLQIFDKYNKLIDIEVNEKPVIINFWTTWCPPCKAELPELIEFYRDNKNSVDFYAVNLTKSEKTTLNMDNFIQEEEINFPVYFDNSGKISDYFNIKSIPTTVILTRNKSGIKKLVHRGAITKEILESSIK